MSADYVFDSPFFEFEHFGGKKPALAHFYARIYITVYEFYYFVERRRGVEHIVTLYHAYKTPLLSEQKFIKEGKHGQHFTIKPEEFTVGDFSVNGVYKEVHKSRNDGLRAFFQKQFFEPVIAQRGKLDVYLADHAYAYFIRLIDGYLLKSSENFFTMLFDFLKRKFHTFYGFAEFFGYLVRNAFRFPFILLVRLDLIFQRQKQISVKNAIKHLYRKRRRNPETGVLFEPVKTYGDYGDESEPRFFQRFAKQRYIVGRSAPAARLKVDKRGFMHVVPAALKRVYKLTYN